MTRINGLIVALILIGATAAGDDRTTAPSIWRKPHPVGWASWPVSPQEDRSCQDATEVPFHRPEKWAESIKMKGVPNLFQVSKTLYRSAQPKSEGMRNLKQHGIVTVVNLRSFSSDQDELGKTNLAYEHIYMKAWHPERKEVVRFLKIVTNPKRTPVLVHCHHGSDRTGTMVALYRVVVEGWTKEEAIEEMTKGGYGFHKVWSNLPDWIEDLDVDSLREEVGIE